MNPRASFSKNKYRKTWLTKGCTHEEGKWKSQKQEWNPTYPIYLFGNITTQINNVGGKKPKKQQNSWWKFKSTSVATQVLHEVQWVIQESFVLLTVQADQDCVSLQLCHMDGIQLLIAWGKKQIILYLYHIKRLCPPPPPSSFFTVLFVTFFFFCFYYSGF